MCRMSGVENAGHENEERKRKVLYAWPTTDIYSTLFTKMVAESKKRRSRVADYGKWLSSIRINLVMESHWFWFEKANGQGHRRSVLICSSKYYIFFEFFLCLLFPIYQMCIASVRKWWSTHIIVWEPQLQQQQQQQQLADRCRHQDSVHVVDTHPRYSLVLRIVIRRTSETVAHTRHPRPIVRRSAIDRCDES